MAHEMSSLKTLELFELRPVGFVLPLLCVAVGQDSLHFEVPIWSLENCIWKSGLFTTVHSEVRLGSRHEIGREAELEIVVLNFAGIPQKWQTRIFPQMRAFLELFSKL